METRKPRKGLSMNKEITLKEYGGQKCDVKIFQTLSSTPETKATFKSVNGFGDHTYTSEQLLEIVREMDNI